mgnify:CR=1 FL=1
MDYYDLNSNAMLNFSQRDYSTRSLILAIGVCYLARLEDETRENYAEHISGQLEELIGGEDIDGSEYLFDQIERYFLTHA